MSKNSVAPAFLTLLDASRESGAHYAYLALLARRGAFKSQRIGGRVFLDRASFEQWKVKYEKRRLATPHGFLAESAAAK